MPNPIGRADSVKAVIFDLDNTLMDFMKMKREAVEAAAEAMVDAGLPIPQKKAISEIDRLYDRFGIEYQKIFDEFLMAVMGKVDPKILAAGVVAYRQIKEGYVKPYPHVATTLAELVRRGYRIGMISDAPAFQAWTRLAGLGLHKVFDFVISFDDSGHKKPSRLPFEAAMKRLMLPPSQIMMVGDNPRRDIVGAKRLGMVTVLAEYGCLMLPDPTDEYQKADFVIGDIRDLLKILH
jgi:putative hydrolase of the HAD superfamily